MLCATNWVHTFNLLMNIAYREELPKKNINKIIHHIHVYIVIQITFKINNINIKAFQTARY